jgi:plastocyanin
MENGLRMPYRRLHLLALLLIAIGVVGLGVVGCGASAYPFNTAGGAMMNGGGGMMGNGGMMNGGGMMGGQGYGAAPTVNATPVPANQPIDREVKVTARNLQFDVTRLVVKKGETVKFAITNQDAVAHNFVSQEGKIAYTYLPPNVTASVVWVAPQTPGIFTALCTFHAGMQMQVVVE